MKEEKKTSPEVEPKEKKQPKKENHKEAELTAKIDKLNQDLASANDKVLRLAAEMQNMRRRTEEEKQAQAKYEGFDLVKSLLPVIDNFERAMAMETEENNKYMEGFKMVYVNMLNALKAVGVEEIDCYLKPFDPNCMEAVLTEQIMEEEQGVVLEVLQKGYYYKDKLLRPAMVKVNE